MSADQRPPPRPLNFDGVRRGADAPVRSDGRPDIVRSNRSGQGPQVNLDRRGSQEANKVAENARLAAEQAANDEAARKDDGRKPKRREADRVRRAAAHAAKAAQDRTRPEGVARREKESIPPVTGRSRPGLAPPEGTPSMQPPPPAGPDAVSPPSTASPTQPQVPTEPNAPTPPPGNSPEAGTQADRHASFVAGRKATWWERVKEFFKS